MSVLQEIRRDLRAKASPRKAELCKRFFKTGPGQYGEGDVFIGLTAPELTRVCDTHKDAPFSAVIRLLRSPIHEERMLALNLLIARYHSAGEADRARIHSIYTRHFQFVNNWDLVDVSARLLAGHYLDGKSTAPLYKWAKSPNLWTRRIAIVATWHFIRKKDFKHTLKISEMLFGDKEDLIHKATGWMLREVGKRDVSALKRFLNKHATRMPRTALRYAIERFSPKERRYYLTLRIPVLSGR